ncbi:MAG: hypothetical protein HY052_08765 [Proteobacteria bacterium]|nr:hypothetical protein [Pseudomonadota bacterium]
MKGKIIHYNQETHRGLISGEDGLRYHFQLSAWIDKMMPRPGMQVGFQCQEQEVLCVCSLRG